MIFSKVQWIIQMKLQLWLASKQRQFLKLFSTMLLLLNSMGKEVETKIKTTMVEAKGILHTIMEDSFKRVTTVIKIAVITSNYNPIPPISPTLIPSIQIIHTQFAKFAINQATQQSIITKG